MVRYLRRRKIERALNNQGAKLDKEIRGFFVSYTSEQRLLYLFHTPLLTQFLSLSHHTHPPPNDFLPKGYRFDDDLWKVGKA